MAFSRTNHHFSPLRASARRFHARQPCCNSAGISNNVFRNVSADFFFNEEE